jgi:hypothetical protein
LSGYHFAADIVNHAAALLIVTLLSGRPGHDGWKKDINAFA